MTNQSGNRIAPLVLCAIWNGDDHVDERVSGLSVYMKIRQGVCNPPSPAIGHAAAQSMLPIVAGPIGPIVQEQQFDNEAATVIMNKFKSKELKFGGFMKRILLNSWQFMTRYAGNLAQMQMTCYHIASWFKGSGTSILLPSYRWT